MKTRSIFAGIFFLAVLFCVSAAAFGAEQKPLTFPIGFRDANGDGVNDLFRDANGDGKDDVTGRTYAHNFQYRDEDRDGKNDLFRDANGDGVNDLFIPGTQARARGMIFSLDTDGDGLNDVTGKPDRGPGMGRGFAGGPDDFIDEDGDGIDDRRMQGMGRQWRLRHGRQDNEKNNGQKDGKGNQDNQNDNDDKDKGKNHLRAL